ncbi:MAG: SurA N-terminal domain-containing protein, partial [Acinetobacter sp.]|nr:SurA N-terminal domain-containing protein [Acinetobacter sp.]
MDAFRNFVKGWPGKILMILFSVPFALLGIESYFSGSSHQGAANVVNGQPVSKEALDAEVKALQQGYLQMVNGDASLLNQEYIEKAALDNLVSRMLLTQQANELGLSPSEEQVKQMIVQNTQLHENGAFSQKKYDTYLQQTGQTNQGFIAAVRDSQALQLLSTTLGLGLVNPNDVNQLFKMANEQRHLHLASVNLAEYKTGVQASDAEIQKYYDEHQVQFMRSAQVDVDYIVVSPSQLNVQAAAPTEEELQQAYQALVQKADKKVKHILVTTQGRSDADAAKRAAEAYAKIQAGESFAQVAKNYSEDTDSNAQGGVIADYTAGAFSESFDQAVNAAKVGQVTQPVKTNFGYHLIVVDA